MSIDLSWSLLVSVGSKWWKENLSKCKLPNFFHSTIETLQSYQNLPTSWSMCIKFLLQALNASVATVSTAAARIFSTSWSSFPVSTTLAARISAMATSAAPPRATPQRRQASAATTIPTRQPRHDRQPRLNHVPEVWLEVQAGSKSLSSSSCCPRSSFSESDLGANNEWSSESIRQPRWFWESQVIFYKAAVFIEVTFVNTQWERAEGVAVIKWGERRLRNTSKDSQIMTFKSLKTV